MMDNIETKHYHLTVYEDDDSHLNIEIEPVNDIQEEEVSHVDSLEIDNGVKERYTTNLIERSLEWKCSNCGSINRDYPGYYIPVDIEDGQEVKVTCRECGQTSLVTY